MKKISLFVFIIIALLCSCGEKHYNEWVKRNNSSYYYDENGQIKKDGTFYIDNNWYYFDENGKMRTGWYRLNDKNVQVYLGNDGVLRKGWQKIGDNWYYFTETLGFMVTGWKEIDHNWYYFEDNGEMIKDWKRIDSKWYYFDKDYGALQVSKWIDNIYYVNENGEMLTSGYHNVDGQMLYFENDGKINRNRNYEQEIRAQQNAANKQNNSSYSSDLPEVHYIYGASSINSVLRECIKYHDSAIAGNRMDVILLKGKVEQLESLVNVARSRTLGEMVGTGRGISSDLEREFKLLNTIIAGLKGYVSKNLY